jgi:hypothetical protein
MLYSMARTYCKAGKREKGFELLMRALNTGISCPEKLEADPAFDSLREDERFLSLVNASKLVSLALKFEEIRDEENLVAALDHAMLISPDYAYPWFLRAKEHARAGRAEDALTCLRASVERGFKNYCLIMAEKSLDSLKSSREFMSILKRDVPAS